MNICGFKGCAITGSGFYYLNNNGKAIGKKSSASQGTTRKRKGDAARNTAWDDIEENYNTDRTAQEACTFLAISRSTLTRWVSVGIVKAYKRKLGRGGRPWQLCFMKADLDNVEQ